MSDQTLVTYEYLEAKDKEIERLTAESEAYRQEYVRLGCENVKLQARAAELEERIEKLLASKFAASSPKLIAKIITLANSEGRGET